MDQLIGLVLHDRFKILQKIGHGSFGVVYVAFDLQEEEYCAAKFEVRSQKLSMMSREIIIMQQLQGINGFPQLIHFAKDQNYLHFISPLFAENLEILLRRSGGRFSLHTVLQLGIQIINRLEVFHSKNFIHRDIKPENFVISREDTSFVILIDFGLSKYYRNREGKHIEYQQKSGVIGTARYASINALQWMEQSRRDDLEAVGYMLVYFAKGELPWQNIKTRTREQKYEQILQMKMGYSLNHLCLNLPKCFVHYFQHVKSLLFTQQPNYSVLRGLFEKQLSEALQMTTLYDWEQKYKITTLPKHQDIESIYPQKEIEQVLPVEDEGQAIHLTNHVHMKFMKQLHEKYDVPPKKDEYSELKLTKICSVEEYQHQESSKMNNYQTSNNFIKVESQPLLNQIENPIFKKRKDSKSLTTLKQAQEFKENRSKPKVQNDDFDLEVAHDDDPQLNMKLMKVNYQKQ